MVRDVRKRVGRGARGCRAVQEIRSQGAASNLTWRNLRPRLLALQVGRLAEQLLPQHDTHK